MTQLLLGMFTQVFKNVLYQDIIRCCAFDFVTEKDLDRSQRNIQEDDAHFTDVKSDYYNARY